MSSEYKGPLSNPQDSNRRPSSELWEQWGLPNDEPQSNDAAQFTHREHVTGALPAFPSDAPLFRPAYQPYPPTQQRQGQPNLPPPQVPYAPGYPQQPQQPQQPQYPQPPVQAYPPQSYAPYPGAVPGYPPQGTYPPQGYPAYPVQPGYQGYAPYAAYPYPGYNGYPPYYAWMVPQPKRDGFHLAVDIISLVGSILAVLGGLVCVGFLLLFMVSVAANGGRVIREDQYFNIVATFTAFALAGIAGGSFSLYHSIRALLKRPSATFKLPWFWIFIILYLLVVGTGYVMHANGQEVANWPLTLFLILLAAIFPVVSLLALGVRRLRFPEWPTNWRRFTVAITSGATLGIGLALILELAALFLLYRGPQAQNYLRCINDPNLPGCSSFTAFNLIFIVVAIVGPIVEETVKPLAVAFFITRMRSAAEAFVLGMSAGLGFALVETIGYIGAGYHDWLNVALERTGAGLLHGFGAGMVALAWYYLLHAKKRRLLLALAFWAYAVFQHMLWNGTAILSLLPDPYGSTINSWNLNLGFTSLPFVEILNILEAILILVFFVYMTGRLRRKTPPPTTQKDEQKTTSASERQLVMRTS